MEMFQKLSQKNNYHSKLNITIISYYFLRGIYYHILKELEDCCYTADDK